MIITVQAFNNTETAVNVTAALATMNAYKYKNTTAIIQLTEAADKDVVDVMNGNNIQRLTKDDEIGFGANGIDEIIRSTQYDTIDKDNIMTMCGALTTEKGRLDALRRTEMTDFVETSFADMDNIMQILTAAEEAYKTVFVIMPVIQNSGEFANTKFVKKLNESKNIDVSIYCFPQGPVNRIKNYKPTGNKIIYCCTEFEPSSVYGCKYFKKEFGHRIIYGLHYNVGYRDALLSENVIDFVRKNKNTSSTDINYWWNKSVSEILKYGLGISEYEEPNEELRISAEEPQVEEPVMRDIDVTKIQEEQIEKGKFFKKKKTYMNTSQAIMGDDEVEGQEENPFEEEDYTYGEHEENSDRYEEAYVESEMQQEFGEEETESYENEGEDENNEEEFEAEEKNSYEEEQLPINEEKQADLEDTELPDGLEQDELKQDEVHLIEEELAPIQSEPEYSEKEQEPETELSQEESSEKEEEESNTDVGENKTVKEDIDNKHEAVTETSMESVYDQIRQIPKDLDDRAYNAVVAHILTSNK